MSSPPAVNTPSASAEDTLIPLMLAACPGMKLDYKRMSAIDGVKSASSFEHRFRKYRVRAQEILAACGGDAVAGTVPEGLTPVTPKKKRATKAAGEGGAGDDGEETPKKKGRTPKKPKVPTTPKTPKTPKAGKGGKGKVDNGENDEDEEGNDDDALQAAHDEGMEDYGYQVRKEMSFEFEGSEL